MKEPAWKDISHGLPYGQFLYTEATAADKTVFLARSNPYVNQDKPYGAVYGSVDRGNHWFNATENLPSTRPNHVLMLGNHLVVTTGDSGVFIAPIAKLKSAAKKTLPEKSL